MKIKVALIAQGIVSGVFGLGFIFLPVQAMGPFGPTEQMTEVFYFLTRGYGILVLSISVLCWMGLKITEKYAKRVLAVGIGTWALLNGILFIYGIASGIVSSFSWTQVGLELILAGLFISTFFNPEP